MSVNIAPSEKLNVAVRYEFKTNLELTTKVFDNKSGGIFVHGSKTIADMPALLAIGAEFKPMDKLTVAAISIPISIKNVDYDGSETADVDMIDNNFLEYGLGLEYGLTEKVTCQCRLGRYIYRS